MPLVDETLPLVGTPFMDLLASSLRYWVAHKMNTDPGWSQVAI
jgi:5'-3' exoribonuclease 2